MLLAVGKLDPIEQRCSRHQKPLTKPDNTSLVSEKLLILGGIVRGTKKPMQQHMHSPVVIKLGGSLFDLKDLFTKVENLVDALVETIWIVPGGGGLANELRRLDAIYEWPPGVSHQLALGTMSLAAKTIAVRGPRYQLVHDFSNGSDEAGSGRIRVLDVQHVPGIDQLPASWNCTSDSIAAWAATQLGAQTLLLAKSVDLPDPVPSLPTAVQLGLVDACFPQAAASLPRIHWINLRDDEIRIQPWIESPETDRPQT